MSKVLADVAADGKVTFEIKQGQFVSTREQDTDPYYEFNATVRKYIDKSAVNRGWALPIGNIPMADYKNLIKQNPDLNSKDAEIRTKAWLKTLRELGNDNLRTVERNLVPDSMTPDKGSIILPNYIQRKMSL